MSETTTCSFCSAAMNPTFLYVRGLGASLHRSARPDVGLLSRADLQQIDLGEISKTETGAQAVIGAFHCESCDSIFFKASS
jgi:hypothetical protein